LQEEHKSVLRHSGSKSGLDKLAAPSDSFFSRAREVNFFVGLISYMRIRLKHYCEFSMVCHAR
jgi:hypothetical protein